MHRVVFDKTNDNQVNVIGMVILLRQYTDLDLLTAKETVEKWLAGKSASVPVRDDSSRTMFINLAQSHGFELRLV